MKRQHTASLSEKFRAEISNWSHVITQEADSAPAGIHFAKNRSKVTPDLEISEQYAVASWWYLYNSRVGLLMLCGYRPTSQGGLVQFFKRCSMYVLYSLAGTSNNPTQALSWACMPKQLQRGETHRWTKMLIWYSWT